MADDQAMTTEEEVTKGNMHIVKEEDTDEDTDEDKKDADKDEDEEDAAI